jgi:hypothetical protein
VGLASIACDLARFIASSYFAKLLEPICTVPALYRARRVASFQYSNIESPLSFARKLYLPYTIGPGQQKTEPDAKAVRLLTSVV